MELLSRFLADGGKGDSEGVGMQSRLIDYELLVGEDGKRTVGFGWFAGGLLSLLYLSISRIYLHPSSSARFLMFS